MSKTHTSLAVPGVRSLKPYQPGKPVSELERELGIGDIVKLASNENPLGPSPRALAALEGELAELTRYPDAGGFELKSALAARHGVDPDCITLGNGSNDVLVLLAEAFLHESREAVYSQYAFAVYPIAVQTVGATARVAPARPSDDPEQPLGHDLDAMRSLIGERTSLVFIANPNNPTGTVLDSGELRSFVADVPTDTLVIVDQAYAEYIDSPDYADCVEWIEEFPHLVVSRTFSKAFGLAGLRVGYAVSAPGIAGILNRVRQPFNVNSLALAAARAALEDEAYLQRSVATNRSELRRLERAFDERGLRYVPSAGNFVLLDLGVDAQPVFEALLRAGVIVRPVANYGLPQHLRISVGTPQENTRFLEALDGLAAELLGR
jgi:histidinol-phosphate aminotransferase